MTTSSRVQPREVAPHGVFVAFSELSVPPEGRAALQRAFQDRLGAVDQWPGFRGLEVWSAHGDSDRFTMVSWWDDEPSFKAYMASPEHRTSHARIPGGEHRPRPVAFTRYSVVER